MHARTHALSQMSNAFTLMAAETSSLSVYMYIKPSATEDTLSKSHAEGAGLVLWIQLLVQIVPT